VQYRALGCTGGQVSSPVLGVMKFGKIGRTAQNEAAAIVDAGTVAGARSPRRECHSKRRLSRLFRGLIPAEEQWFMTAEAEHRESDEGVGGSESEYAPPWCTRSRCPTSTREHCTTHHFNCATANVTRSSTRV
jgi:hypothetical protein